MNTRLSILALSILTACGTDEPLGGTDGTTGATDAGSGTDSTTGASGGTDSAGTGGSSSSTTTGGTTSSGTNGGSTGGADGMYGDCFTDEHCADGLTCQPWNGADDNHPGFCTQGCIEDSDCPESADADLVEAGCVLYDNSYVPEPKWYCALRCSADLSTCPGDLECLPLAGSGDPATMICQGDPS